MAVHEHLITLDPAIEFNKGSFSELTLREPTAGEMNRALGELAPGSTQASHRMQITLVTIVSGWPRGAVEALPNSRLQEAAEWLLGFTDAGPKTGEN